MVTYTAMPGESLEDFLERAGYTHLDKLNKANKPTLIANCLSQKKETPSYDDIPDEFKVDKKKAGQGKHGADAEVALPFTALIRYFKDQSARNKKERAERAKERSHDGGLAVKGGRVSKR